MNTKQVIAAVGIAFAASGAFAAEFTNFDLPAANNQSRAEVQAQAASRVLGREVRYVGDAAVVDLPAASASQSRAEVASRVLGRTVIFNEATTFVDAPQAPERAAQVLARSFR